MDQRPQASLSDAPSDPLDLANWLFTSPGVQLLGQPHLEPDRHMAHMLVQVDIAHSLRRIADALEAKAEPFPAPTDLPALPPLNT